MGVDIYKLHQENMAKRGNNDENSKQDLRTYKPRNLSADKNKKDHKQKKAGSYKEF